MHDTIFNCSRVGPKETLNFHRLILTKNFFRKLNGENMFANIRDATKTFVSLIIKGSKTIRSLIGRYLAMVNHSEQLLLLMLTQICKFPMVIIRHCCLKMGINL